MTTQGTPQEAPAAPAPPTPVVRPTTNGSEKRKQRGVAIRVLVYVVVAHLMAAYLYFMFEVASKH
jgi:hypothetical protein